MKNNMIFNKEEISVKDIIIYMVIIYMIIIKINNKRISKRINRNIESIKIIDKKFHNLLRKRYLMR